MCKHELSQSTATKANKCVYTVFWVGWSNRKRGKTSTSMSDGWCVEKERKKMLEGDIKGCEFYSYLTNLVICRKKLWYYFFTIYTLLIVAVTTPLLWTWRSPNAEQIFFIFFFSLTRHRSSSSLYTLQYWACVKNET